MIDEEKEALRSAYYLARQERIAAERRATEWLCEEQRLAHKLWRADDDGA